MFYMLNFNNWQNGVQRNCDVCHGLFYESEMRGWPLIPDERSDCWIQRPVLELCGGCSEKWERSSGDSQSVAIPVQQIKRDGLDSNIWAQINLRPRERIWSKDFDFDHQLVIYTVGESDDSKNQYYFITWEGIGSKKAIALLPANQFKKIAAIELAFSLSREEWRG